MLFDRAFLVLFVGVHQLSQLGLRFLKDLRVLFCVFAACVTFHYEVWIKVKCNSAIMVFKLTNSEHFFTKANCFNMAFFYTSSEAIFANKIFKLTVFHVLQMHLSILALNLVLFGLICELFLDINQWSSFFSTSEWSISHGKHVFWPISVQVALITTWHYRTHIFLS